TNDMSTIQTAVRDFFETMGVDLSAREGKSVFYNDRTLVVRGTRQDLDVIESAVSVLNTAPPSVAIKAKFADTYYLGGILDTNGAMTSTNGGIPNAYARTNLIWTSSRRQLIRSKLDKLRLDPINYEGLPLNEVLINLNEQAKKHDPERRGVNLIINP